MKLVLFFTFYLFPCLYIFFVVTLVLINPDDIIFGKQNM